MDLELSGQSVVVTGAGSNIGLAIAVAFASEGAALTLGDVDAEQTERVANEAIAAGAASAQFVRTDVTDLEQVTEVMSAAHSLEPKSSMANRPGLPSPTNSRGKPNSLLTRSSRRFLM